MNNINIVFGKNGYIASNWRNGLKSQDKTVFVSKSECDLLNKNSINKFLQKYKDFNISVFLLSAIVRKIDNNLSYKKYLNGKKSLLIIKNLMFIFFFFK